MPRAEQHERWGGTRWNDDCRPTIPPLISTGILDDEMQNPSPGLASALASATESHANIPLWCSAFSFCRTSLDFTDFTLLLKMVP